MANGRQAKVLSEHQIRAILKFVETTRHPLRDRVMILLSVRAGLRAKEIASLTWSMVTDPEMHIQNIIDLQDTASKGKSGRKIPMHRDLGTALVALQKHEAVRRDASGFNLKPTDTVITSERDGRMLASSVAKWFDRLYEGLGFEGCSSHSGRRTAITAWSKAVAQAGGQLRDVQEMAGHSRLGTTQLYMQGDSNAKRNIINMC